MFALSAFPHVKHAWALIKIIVHLEWTLTQQVLILVNAPVCQDTMTAIQLTQSVEISVM